MAKSAAKPVKKKPSPAKPEKAAEKSKPAPAGSKKDAKPAPSAKAPEKTPASAGGVKPALKPGEKPAPRKNEITIKSPTIPKAPVKKPVLLSALPVSKDAPAKSNKPVPPAPGDPKVRFKTAFQNDFSDGKAAAAKLFAAAGLGNLKHQKLPTLEDEMAAKPLTKSPLNKSQLKEFREQLVLKRAELVGDVTSMESEALTGGSGSLSNLPQHMADQGTDTFDQTMALNIAASKRQILRDIDAALKRIDDNTYGICEMLGKPIEPARLQAEPWTRYSIEGARHKERMSLMR